MPIVSMLPRSFGGSGLALRRKARHPRIPCIRFIALARMSVCDCSLIRVRTPIGVICLVVVPIGSFRPHHVGQLPISLRSPRPIRESFSGSLSTRCSSLNPRCSGLCAQSGRFRPCLATSFVLRAGRHRPRHRQGRARDGQNSKQRSHNPLPLIESYNLL